MDEDMDEETEQALALSMQEWQVDQASAPDQPQPGLTSEDVGMDAEMQQALAMSLQDDEEPAAPDTVMLQSQEETAPPSNAAMSTQASAHQQPGQSGSAASQQPQQAVSQQAVQQIAPAVPAQLPPELQSIANALAQAMGAITNMSQSGAIGPASRAQLTQELQDMLKVTPPQWVGPAFADLPQLLPQPDSSSGVTIPTNEELDVTAALEKAFAMPVIAVQGTKQPHAGTRGGLILRLAVDSKNASSWWLSDAQIDMTIKTKLRPARGALQLQTFHKHHQALQATTGSGAVKAVLSRWQSRLAQQALQLVGKPEDDDLYFDSGHQSQDFITLLGSSQLHSTFVEAMVAETRTQKEVDMWLHICGEAMDSLKSTNFTDSAALQSKLFALDVLLRPTLLKHILALELVKYANAGKGTEGDIFEQQTLLAPLLAVSTMPDCAGFLRTHQINTPAKDFFTSLRRYPSNRGEVESSMRGLRAALGHTRQAAHGICERLIKLKEPVGLGREAVLSYIAASVGTSTRRTIGGESKGAISREAVEQSSSDGFVLGLLGMCLLFCKPFLGGEQKFLDRLNPSYYSHHAYRLPEVQSARTLAGREESYSPAPVSHPYVSPNAPGSGGAHFVAECFFLTQTLVHTGLLPAVYRFSQMAERLHRLHEVKGEDEDGGEAQSLDMWLLSDSATAQLLDPQLAAPAVQFLVLEAQWLLHLARQDEASAKKAFASIPEYVIRDMTGWLSFVIQSGQADLVASCRLDVLIAFLTEMLQQLELVQSPIVHAKIVELLLAMLSPQLGRRRRRGLLGPSHQSVGEQALVAAVLGTGAAQESLVPALMNAYAAADHVVGLDVDKDQFDKFSMRNSIDLILLELWKDQGCAASLTRLAEDSAKSSKDSTFSQYAAAVLNSLVYLLKDSLERLQDIHNIEVSMADEAAWKGLPPRERSDKEAFYEGQGHTTQGFMRMARTTLALLNKLSGHPSVKQSFLQPPLVGSSAYNCLHFLELLVGPQGVGLKVKDPQKYHFDPKSLLLQICEVLLRLAEDDRFVASVAAEPDYEEPVLRKAHHILTSKQLGEYEHAARLEKLISQVAERRQVAVPPGVGASSSTPASQQEVQLPDLALPAPPSNTEQAYQQALQPLSVADFDASAPQAYNRAFAVMAEQAAGDTQAKMKRLSREMRNLRGKTSLPIHMASSIFVRHDADRMDLVRAMITGPEGTPYHGGCFMFDVFFPQDYPNVPPLMNMATNGEGRARFNPNLYADGKVCLSLLGTWHGTDASQKWDPQQSSLFQILLSIQGMILISDPYFNEPNVELMRGQAEGTKASNSYNAEIHLNNIRWAMIDQLRKPKPGFEDAIKLHFLHIRSSLIKQCKDWFDESAGMDVLYRRRLADAIVELHGLLSAL